MHGAPRDTIQEKERTSEGSMVKRIGRTVHLTEEAHGALQAFCDEARRKPGNALAVILLWARGKTIPGLEPIAEVKSNGDGNGGNGNGQ